MITLTLEAWKKFAPHCPANYTAALFDNLHLLEDAGILETELRWCHFAATVYEETGDFSEIRESLKYTTCKALKSTWPSRFAHKTDDELKPLLKNERGLAEAVYGGRMGNRPGTLDAFAYRGGGWIQTTGREAVERYCKAIGIEATPTALDDPLTTLRFAILEWTEAKCNQWADENSIRKVAKAINTGSATSNVEPIGLDDRKKAFARAWKHWGDTGTADKPASTEDLKAAIKDAAVKYGGPAVAVAGGGAHVATKATQDAPAPAVDVKKHLEKAQEVRAQVEQAKDYAGWIKTSLSGDGGMLFAAVAVGAVCLIGYETLFRRRA